MTCSNLFPAGLGDMDLDNALHGHLVAAVFETLLVDGGYQVVPLGIERSVRELRTFDRDTYLELVHPRLRSFPDFFVLDLDARQSWLLEIKYRPYLHPLLVQDLEPLQRDWAPCMLILALADPPAEWTGVIRHIRVFEMDSKISLDVAFLKHAGRRLQDVFVRLTDKWEEATIAKAQEAILRITPKH